MYRVAKLGLVQAKYTRKPVANPKNPTVPPMGLLCHAQPCHIELHYDNYHTQDVTKVLYDSPGIMEQPIRLAFFTYELSNGQAKICQNKMLVKRAVQQANTTVYMTCV